MAKEVPVDHVQLFDPTYFYGESCIEALEGLKKAAERMKITMDAVGIDDPNWKFYATAYQLYCFYLENLAGDLRQLTRMTRPELLEPKAESDLDLDMEDFDPDFDDVDEGDPDWEV